ncbi:MAG: prolyl oligopeptidase family serine peptidase [Burkholderiales bacterium]
MTHPLPVASPSRGFPCRVLATALVGAALACAAAVVRADEPPDRYLWLEDIDGPKALEWVKARNAETAQALEGPEFRQLEQRFLTILRSDQRIPYVARMGSSYYNFWRDAEHPRGVWRRTSLVGYAKPQPKWETVLDLDRLAADEGESWVWHGAQCLPPEYRRCLLSLSPGGSDAKVVREFDTVERAFVVDGFRLPKAKTIVDWVDRDTILVGTDFGPDSLTKSGYPRLVKQWRRGTPLAAATMLYTGRPDDMMILGSHDTTPGFERTFVQRRYAFFRTELFLQQRGRLVKIDKPDSADIDFHREWAWLTLREPWEVAGVRHEAGSLLAIRLDRFMAGDRHFETLFVPGARTSLAGVSATRHHLLVTTLDNVRTRITLFSRDKGRWQGVPLPGVPDISTAWVWAQDERTSDDYFMSVTDFLVPTQLRMGVAGGAPATVVKQLPALFDAKGLTVSQHEAVSKDGTRIPYFQVSRSALATDGRNPTLLYGYGGFESTETPYYAATVGAGWLERGGAYVQANIRGGGEFGPQWHQAAVRANKMRSYEDFIAVAEDLVRRGVTSPAHLAAKGESNGGLLTGNMLTLRPDLFGAVVPGVPLLDLRRYTQLLAGPSWVAELGDPDDPAEWAVMQAFSPYQNVRAGTRYPPTLLLTSTRDDRVHPAHSRKMAARLRDAGQEVLLYENTEGGHAGSATIEQRAYSEALTYQFLWQHLR